MAPVTGLRGHIDSDAVIGVQRSAEFRISSTSATASTQKHACIYTDAGITAWVVMP